MAFSGNRKLSNDRVSTADSPACRWMAHWSKDGQDSMRCLAEVLAMSES